MSGENARRAAGLLLRARETRVPLDVAALDCAPADRGEVYAIQALVADALGPVGGWKVGAKSPDGESLFAPLARSGIHESTASLHASAFPLRGIEAEVAYRLGADLPPRESPWTADEVAVAVDAVLPVIEVVESRLVDREASGPLWPLADHQSHGALILGPARAGWRGLDALAPHVRIAFGDHVVVDCECRNAAGDPFAQVVRLANLAGRHCGGLRAGQVVTTGSLMGIEYAPARCPVRVEVGDLGVVEVRFD